MARGKGKVIIKKMPSMAGEDHATINTMFSQMTGMEDAEPEIIIPKILNIKSLVVKYCKLFNLLIEFKEFRTLCGQDDWFVEIKDFIDQLEKSANIDIKVDYRENPTEYRKLCELSKSMINENYNRIKDCPFVKQIVITSGNLSRFKKYLEMDFDDSFIKQEPGFDFVPFAFTKMDLKKIWYADNMTEQPKKYLMSILKHAYKIGTEMYDIISSPNVDVKEFSALLIGSISQIKKHIPRCDKAFEIIENSVKMLEDNFKSYFRSSIEAENPSIIIESFIVDISTTQKANPTVKRQFERIVSFLRQKNANNNDPKIKKLFGMLNNQFSAMDKEMGIKKEESSEDSGEPSEEDYVEVNVE